MSEAKHTPGPWKFQSKSGQREVTLLRTHWEIGSLSEGLPGIGLAFGDDDANARLIAAAPDLLAVASAYKRWEADLILCDQAWNGVVAPLPTLTQGLWDRLLEIQAMRNAAIAKAKGRPA